VSKELISEDMFGSDNSASYDIIFEATACGPFDGGCLFVADSIHKAIMSLTKNGVADHACVFRDGLYYDFDGAKEKDAFIEHFREEELLDIRKEFILDIREFCVGDLPDAPNNFMYLYSVFLAKIISDNLNERKGLINSPVIKRG